MVRESLRKDLRDDEPAMERGGALLAGKVASTKAKLCSENQSKAKVTNCCEQRRAWSQAVALSCMTCSMFDESSLPMPFLPLSTSFYTSLLSTHWPKLLSYVRGIGQLASSRAEYGIRMSSMKASITSLTSLTSEAQMN